MNQKISNSLKKEMNRFKVKDYTFNDKDNTVVFEKENKQYHCEVRLNEDNEVYMTVKKIDFLYHRLLESELNGWN